MNERNWRTRRLESRGSIRRANHIDEEIVNEFVRAECGCYRNSQGQRILGPRLWPVSNPRLISRGSETGRAYRNDTWRQQADGQRRRPQLSCVSPSENPPSEIAADAEPPSGR